MFSELIYWLILHNWKEIKAYYPQIIPKEKGKKVQFSRNPLLYVVPFFYISLFYVIWCFALNTDVFLENLVFILNVHFYYKNTYLYELFAQYFGLHNIRNSCFL